MSRHGTGLRRRDATPGGFRRWRRTRPFWGGLLVALGGGFIILQPLLNPLPLIIQQGIAGISGWLVGALMLAIGVLTWVQPAQRMFFGIVAILLSLASFVTSNFGGFVVGMLLGIVGGALVFAWMPERPPKRGSPPPEPPEDDEEPTVESRVVNRAVRPDDTGEAGEAAARPATPEDGADDSPPDGRPGADTSGRARAVVALPLALTIVLSGAAAPADGPWDWLNPGGGDSDEDDGGDGGGDKEPSDPPTSPSLPDAPGSPSPSPAPPGEDGADQGGGDADKGEEDDAGDGNADECELKQGGSSVAGSKKEFLKAVKDCQDARDRDDLPRVRSRTSDDDRFLAHTVKSGLTADELSMEGASFDGVVDYPTHDGSRRYLKMSMDKAELTGATQFFRHRSDRHVLGIPSATMSGNVEMHVTRMTARILGIKLTFTPDFPPPLLLPTMTVTDLEADQPLAEADSMDIEGLGSGVESA